MGDVRKAVVFQHSEPVTLGRLRGPLERAGYLIEERFREVRGEDAQADLVVVLGGYMGMYELDAYPFLREELAMVVQRLRDERPVLGVCLGAQMIAQAAGSHVGPDPKGMFVGAERVRFNDGTSLHLAAWHGDRFEPIPGAVSLASSERHPQEVFRLGARGRAVGILTHPEAAPETFAQWVHVHPETVKRAGRTEEEIVARDLPLLEASGAMTVEWMDALVLSLSDA